MSDIVEGSIKRFSDVEMINELESRGFIVQTDDYTHPDEEVHEDISKLYMDYMLIGGEFFNKQLRLFFNRYLDKNL